MAQMAGYDFSVVTPLRRAVTEEELLQEQDRQIAQGADPLALSPEDRALADRPIEPLPELMPDPLTANDGVMPGLYNAQEQAALEQQRKEPYEEPALPAEDGELEQNLPPVQTAAEEAYDFSSVTPMKAKAEPDQAEPFDFSKVQPLPGPAGSSQLAYDTTVRPENVEGPIPFGEQDRPYRTRADGTLEFDPRRMGDGVTQALKDQIITGEQYAKLQPSIEAAKKVIFNEEKLRARAKDNGALASAIQGAGRGGAMTLGGIAGVKAGAAAGLLTGPYAPVASPVLGLVGGVAGAVTMGMNYDLVYKELAKHYDEYDAVLAAAELNPGWNAAGELVSVAVGVPQALRGASRALATTLSKEGAGAVARQVGIAAGSGAGSGVAGYSLDRTVRGEPITAGGMATAAAAGAAFAPFMITPGMAGTPEMASITAKVRAGQPISPMEQKIYQSAAPALRAAFAEMDAAGGVRVTPRYDQAGKFVSGAPEVSVPTSSVLGLAPAAGKATVRIPYTVPARLGAPAAVKAQAFAARGAAGERTAGPAVPTGETAPVVPRTAPINVLSPGPTISTPTQAMLGVEEYLARQVGVRGIQTKDNFDAILGLMDEHKQIVTDALGRNEPVSIDALDSYEIRVPYYDRDETTGLATYSEESYKAYENYLKGQDAEGAGNARSGGIDIFDAIRDSGGLPSGKSSKVKQWSGELQSIREAQNPGNAVGVKGTLNLFRKDAPDLDGLIKNLQGYGFKVTTPPELFDLIGRRFNTGKPIYAYGDEEIPFEMRGRRAPAPGAPRQGELLGESDVDFSLVGQADRTSLTPAEQAAAAAAEAAKAEAERGQGDLFGEVRGGRRAAQVISEERKAQDGSTVVDMRKANGKVVTRVVATINGHRVGDRFDDGMAVKKIDAKDVSSEDMPDEYKIEEITTIQGKNEVTTTIRDMTSGEIAAKQAQLERGNQKLAELGAEPRPIPAVPKRLSGAVSTDPLTPPLDARAGGPAKVPPGTPVGMRAMQPPDWVLQRGETSEGRRLIKGIQNYKVGQKWSFGHIVGMLNKAVQLEMRRTKSQVTKQNPAHYLPINKVAFTGNTQDQVNFHEAGHQLQHMLQDRVPDIWKAHETELVDLTKRPGSMASEPPANATAVQKRNYILGEGVAEWLRLLMVEPRAVEGMAVSPTIVANADKFYPGMSRQIRDAVRSMNAFMVAPSETMIGMFGQLPTEPVSANSIFSLVKQGKDATGNVIASGAPVDRMRTRIIKAIMQNYKETGMTYKQAVAAVSRVSNKLAQPVDAYNMILSIDQEVQLAYSGTTAAKGLRVMDDDGKLVYFTRWTWNELRDKVPYKYRTLFDQAAWAMETNERYVRAGMEYEGMREGITPEVLMAKVKEAQQKIPGFGQMFAQQSNFLHSVNEIREFGGILSAEERFRIQFTRPTYWPKPRQFAEGGRSVGKSGAQILKGVYRAFGSGEPAKPVDEAALQAVEQALEAHYWNRFMRIAQKRAVEVTTMKNLPWEARQVAGAMFVRLKVPQRKVATLSEDEMALIKKDVIKALADQMEQTVGYRPDIDPKTVHVAYSFKDVYRPVEPGDVRVMASYEKGERVYTQIGDPALYAMMAAGHQVTGLGGAALGAFRWVFGPLSRNVQRLITQAPEFAVPSNLARDIMSQMLLNPHNDLVDWIPGYTHMVGTWNKFSKKYPQVFLEGLLLSRNQPNQAELLYRAKHTDLWSFFTQSLYVSQDKDPTKRLLGTVMNPTFVSYPLWLLGDIANAIRPGAAAGALAGSAVAGPAGMIPGAILGAIAGPITGFTGAGINQFIESAGREGAAVRTLQRGGTDEQALKQYWLRSGQFNERSGVAGLAQIMRIIPFANPSLQGSRNGVQALTDADPARKFTAWSRVGYVMGLAAAYAVIKYLIMPDEEKDKERERTIEDRLGYMNIGGIRVPFAYGIEGALQSLTHVMVMDDLLERRADPKKYAVMVGKRIFDAQGLFNVFGPQVAAFQDTKKNWKSYQETPIVSPWMVNLPASEQYYSTTPDFYVKIGRMFNWSPAKLQYFVQQAITKQVDETIRLVEGVSGGKPFMEPADVPFVGRMFIRDPIGFASQSVRDLGVTEDRLRSLSTRLNAKGWGSLGQFDKYGDPVVSAEDFAKENNLDPKMARDLVNVQMQLQYLQGLKKQIGVIDTLQAYSKAYALKEDYANERNMRVMMTRSAQAAMAGNQDALKMIDFVTERIDQLAPAPPQMQATDYLNRRF